MRSHPIYASLYDKLNTHADATWLGEVRRSFGRQARGRVLEIGAGTGMNLVHYQDVELVIATEPDPAYLRQLRRRAPEASVPVRVIKAPAERLPVHDHSVDTVISTLTMCSVDDPDQVARELRRVLRPDGRLLLFEHTKTNRGRVTEVLQNMSVPFWRWFVGGCHVNRPTLDTLRRHGFRVDLVASLDPPLTPRVMFPFVTAVAEVAAHDRR